MILRRGDGYALRRLALKLGLILFFAIQRWPEGPVSIARKLSLMTALLNILIAACRRQRLLARNLTYWDEAAAFALLFLLLGIFA